MVEVENKRQFLVQLGSQRKQELISNATEWELRIHKLMESLPFSFEFQYPIICDKRQPPKKIAIQPHHLKLYILDFYLPEYKLAIEIDGYAYHGDKEAKKKDKTRTKHLKWSGIDVIRLSNPMAKSLTKVELLQIIRQSIKTKK